MGITMINPDTGKPEKITGGHAGLWVVLFGPLYFMWKGMWSYIVPFGYIFYIGEYVKDSYRRRGWRDVTPPKDESRTKEQAFNNYKKALLVAALFGLCIFGVDLEEAEAEWIYQESKDELTGKVAQQFIVSYSENKVEGWLSERKILLGVVCGEKDPYLRTNDISLTGSIDCTEYGCTTKQKMRFKFDNISEPLALTAYVWEHNNGASFRSGKLVDLMKPAGSVKVEFEPILTQGRKVVADFSLIGFSKALSKCKRN